VTSATNCNTQSCLHDIGANAPERREVAPQPPRQRARKSGRVNARTERHVRAPPMICPESGTPVACQIRLGVLGVADRAGGANAPITLPVLACLIIFDCLRRLVTPGGPWPVTPWNYVSMGFDLLSLVVLVALWRTYPTATPRGASARPLGRLAVWAWSRRGNHPAAVALHQRPCLVDRTPQRRRLLDASLSSPGAPPLPFRRSFVYCAAQSIG
jgi:hypothetical protein